MDKNRVAEVLRTLASGEKYRPESARLRDVFDSVENALSAGVSRAAILEALHGNGFTMTLKTFDNAIYRIRKQKAAQKNPVGRQSEKPIHDHQEIASNGITSDQRIEENTTVDTSHNPADLTQIMSATVDLDALSKHAKRKK